MNHNAELSEVVSDNRPYGVGVRYYFGKGREEKERGCGRKMYFVG